MILHEIYSCYFDAVTRILHAACAGKRGRRWYVAALSGLSLPSEVQATVDRKLGLIPVEGEESYRLMSDGQALVQHCPEMPLTLLEKRWLKSVLQDPRVALFDVSDEGLEDVEPLYSPENIVVFDRSGDADPWGDAEYIGHFKTILGAIENHRRLEVSWLCREGMKCVAVCDPDRLEYSEVDDKFRLWADADAHQVKINLSRIVSCTVSDAPLRLELPEGLGKTPPMAQARGAQASYRSNFQDEVAQEHLEALVIEVSDERRALERALIHFSHFQKQEVMAVSDKIYRIRLSIDEDDRPEILRRVLAFGPFVRVIEPSWLVAEVRKRISEQMAMLGM